MGNKFLNSVEISEQECCWDLLELPMTQSSVKVEFISTCPPDDRVFIAKDDTILQNMDPDSEDLGVAGNIEKYAKHSKILEDWCLADYVSKLDTRSTTTEKVEHSEEINEFEEDDANHSETEQTESLFPIYLRNNKVLYK